MIAFAWLCFLAFHFRIAWVNAKHGIIPDGLTYSGAFSGVVISGFLPLLQGENSAIQGVLFSVAGGVVGFFVVWALSEFGKIVFGVKRLQFSEPAAFELRIAAPEGWLTIGESTWVWSDFFYRDSDRLRFKGEVRIEEPHEARASGSDAVFSVDRLWLAGKEFEIARLTLVAGRVECANLPREVIGFGVVKLFLFAGTFLGPIGVLLYLAATMVVIVGFFGFQFLRSRLFPSFAQASLIQVGPCAAVAAVVVIVARVWRLGWI